MSAYNRRAYSSQENRKVQSFKDTKISNTPPTVIPGTPLQQMWTILNFHEHRLGQMTQYLQKIEKDEDNIPKQAPSETEHMIQYNTLLQQVSDLTERVAKLEGETVQQTSNMVSLNIEEDLQNASIGQPEV